MKQIFLTLLICMMTVSVGFADDARGIVQKMLDRNDGTTEISRIKLSTARYGQKGKKLVNIEKPRVKVMDTVWVNSRDSIDPIFLEFIPNRP